MKKCPAMPEVMTPKGRHEPSSMQRKEKAAPMTHLNPLGLTSDLPPGVHEQDGGYPSYQAHARCPAAAPG